MFLFFFIAKLIQQKLFHKTELNLFVLISYSYEYSIIAERDYTFFSIDNETGLLNVSGSFDAEGQSVYIASVLVQDPRVACLKGRTRVILTITDINDNPPVFTQPTYSTSVTENTSLYTPVITITANDLDSGINSQLVFSFDTSPTPNTDFSISADGVVTVTGPLDGVITPQYTYTVVATDSGEPAMSATAELSITVTTVNQQPEFIGCSTGSCTLSLPEDTDVGQLGYYLFATDPDIVGPDADLTWSGGSAPFDINSTTGELSLTMSLDRETTNTYTLTFVVSDGGDPSLSATGIVTVIVTDVNDNPPVFGKDNYSANIPENQGPTELFRAVATDIDMGENADIVYSLSDAEYFSIDSEGSVSTTKAFDFENIPSNPLVFSIIATDGIFNVNVPGSLSITDLNDNSPDIIGDFNVTLSEDVLIGTLVFNLTITDADSGTGGEVTVAIVDGNQDELFTLEYADSQAIIRVGSTGLDFEISRTHSLNLRATDGGDPARITPKNLVLTVLDVNDNTPVCGSDKNSSLREDVPIGTRVGQVLATDGDMLGSPNSQITYSITAVNSSQTDLQLFSISSDGEVTTSELLDIEVSPQYTITVTASDNGNAPLSCTASIVLTLEDVNEFPPVINTTSSTLNVTVREDTPINTVIATVVATDADLTSAAIIYELMNTDFSINSETGQIIVSRSLDYETTPSYQLVVVATDGQNEQTAIIDVQVTNINDITPMIDITSPVVVPENVVIDSVVCVPIIDGDGDANGIFTLSFSVSGVVSSFLSFNTTSSCFSIVVQLDREGELGDSFNVIVTVNDNGEPNLHSTSEFLIQITDVNDNSPVFSADVYTATVPENTATGTPIGSVLATDIDAGINREIDYTTNSSRFSIDNEGLITVNDVLDYEVTDRIVLLVTATDRGTPSLEDTALFIVTITDVNDNSPTLTNLPDTVSFQENGVTQMLIFEVTSSDLDTDPDSLSPTYSIISITPSNTPNFTINPSTGSITADATQFDREAIPSYTLSISVYDGSNSPTSTLTVQVTDENDNAPVLLGDLSFSVRECEQDCEDIFKIQTSDNDMAGTANAQLGAVHIFDTTSFTATIYSTNLISISCISNTLDFETATTESFTLQVTDNGTYPLSTSRTIQVQVLDCNDNSPVFSPASMEIELREDTPIDTVVATFNATDPDSEVAGEVTYRQTDPNEPFFTINAVTGAVTLIRTLDFEDMTNHTFYVIASDSGSPSLSANSFLRVTVLNVNDNLPVFSANNYIITLAEDTDTGYVYSDITATDEDEDDILFYLTGDSPFQLDEQSADLTLVTELDFENQQMYSFTISAKNPNSSVSVTAEVKLNVMDVNDNSPVITNQVVTYNVTEDTQTGTFVFTVTAQDPDSGVNGMFHFFFHYDVTDFNITSDGVVTTSMPLDRETTDEYKLAITVQDMGDPAMSSSTYFTVLITDVNDNRPVFNSSEYFDSISEATPINSSLNIVVLVSDLDFGANSEIDLTDDSIVFDIMNNGTVILVQTLDYELQTMYMFTVTATDRGNPSLSNTANYTVTVENVNDNTPVFSPSQFQQNIQEYNQLTDSCECSGVIFTAQATDADNDILTYSMTDSNLFSINSTSGELTASCNIDRETDDSFVIIITASDGAFEANLTLYLTVTDVNDNIPYFESPNMTVQVSEATQIGAEIASVVVGDRDIGSNGAVELSIAQTDPSSTNSVLTILQDGTITLSSGLDFESIREYEFLITATDMGSPSLTNRTTFILTVSDANDNTPMFNSSNYSVSFYENTTPQSVICVSATDDDEDLNAQLTFFVVNSSQVSDELESAFSFSGCCLNVNQSFDFEQIQSFTIYIGVRDAGNPSLSSSVPLYVAILDVNDNDPVFVGEYPDPLMVSENTLINTVILTLEANDADSGLNGDVTLSLEPDDTFNITSDGNLYTLVLLDFETTETYWITIVATDMGDVPRNISLYLHIQVVNENDNTPMFNQSDYQFYILEDSNISTIIGITPATDGDAGVFGELYYSVVTALDDVAEYYNIQYDRLGTLIGLDRETTASYSLVVQVADGGDPPLFDLADVTITILDVNDNSPVFDNNTVVVTIPENSPTNSLVVELHATDADQPNTPNSLITFSPNDTRFSLETDSTLGTVIIRTNKTTVLDRETQSIYVIRVTATDNGTPALSSTAYVTIIISDVNDNAPMFSAASANRTLPEDTAVDTLVATFLATDRDENPTIQYTIEPSDTFYINSTGSVFLNESLDFETTQFYSLTISATDSVNSQTATLLVYVSDVNEFSPSFLQNYTASIYENSPTDSFIVTVEATDEDGTSLLRYSVSGERASEFIIGDSSGNVTSQVVLDREDSRGSEIILQLQVTDSGNPDLMGFATLSIEVLDVNDNAPEFVNFPATLTFPEDATELNQIQAIDRDIGDNADILFSLDEDFNLFNITPDGLLELIDSFDFEVRTSYNLTVVATDGGVNPLSTSATVQIDVTDVNDNIPVFLNSVFTADVTEHVGSTVVFTAVASDADSGVNAQLRFSLSSNLYFSIDQITGEVNVTGVIDREIIDTINVTITVCDGGIPARCASRLLTVTVTDINDQSPQFPLQEVMISIPEGAATNIHEVSFDF